MKSVPPSIVGLIRELNKLPGIGSKTSERFVYHLLRGSTANITALAGALNEVKKTIGVCRECFTYAENDICGICSDSTRTKAVICVVAEPKEVMAFEKASDFDGVYHVLGGLIDHTQGIGPQQLRVEELKTRIANDATKEIILATNPNMEGDTTALYIAQQLADLPVTITKIARGLPMGADIQFADEVTLGNALSERQSFTAKK
jgi:recombination protein RecR